MTSLDNVHAESLPSIVLFVGPHADTLATYAAFFEAAGLWVATARDPVEALAAVQELKPDLVITDEFEAADLDLVHALKTTPESKAVPVILLTRRLRGVPAATREEADLCLETPVLPDTLLQSSRTIIGKARSSRQNENRERASGASARVEVVRTDADTARRCPACAAPLEWIERGRLYGIEYDYYRWCPKGCGLYCYDCSGQSWVKLA